MPRLLIQGHAADLTDADQIGVGGEATVYRHVLQDGTTVAVKVYHPGQDLAAKAKKVLAFPQALPLHVVTPIFPVEDTRKRFAGYAMRWLPKMTEAARLSQRLWRDQYPQVRSSNVLEVFRALRSLVLELHPKVVIGDFNDGNVLFRSAPAGAEVALIDCDSLQFAGYPCTVGHEKFVAPWLYGTDLETGPFTEDSDWYAFSVMLFQSLLCVHPYGGVHKDLRTPLRRAEAAHSILKPDVRWPRAATAARVLSDDLTGYFHRVFDERQRGPLPAALLDRQFTVCACGAEHQRRQCPLCTVAVHVPAEQHHGKCTVREVFRTKGVIVFAASALGYLGVFVRMPDGKLVDQDGADVEEPQVPSGFDLFTAFRFYEDPVNCRLMTRGVIAGRILPGQTWLRTNGTWSFGFYRVGRVQFYFLHEIGQAGLGEVQLPQLAGRIVDADCTFDLGGHVLFSVAEEVQGRERHHCHLIKNGIVLASASGTAADSRLFQSVHGKALYKGRIVCATDDGLMSAKAEGGSIVEGKVFTDTEPFVGAGERILAGPSGSIYVVRQQTIVQLTLG